MGERRAYEWLLCGWNNCHSISGFGVLINIVSKVDIIYRVTIGDMPHCTCPDFTKMSFQSLEKKGKWVYCKHLYYVFRVLCKVDYDSDKCIHAPTYFYNKVMQLLELAVL
jgi:hypothetical protein